MSRRNTKHPLQKSASGPKSRRPWHERASNKRQKKRILQGEAIRTAKRSRKQRDTTKKRRTVKRPIPAMLSLVDSFSEVTDPRVNRRRRHGLIDIIIIAMLAVMCNADTWKDINIWGVANHQWLETFLELPNGIPSRDTFRRTISRIAPDQFQKAFLRWLGCINKKIKGVIAIDGKTLRRSRNGDKGPLHIVSAWACEQHLTLGQRTVDGKSNEITAIPQLLATLTLQGAIVTIDAMGCQKNIASQIVAARADFCLAVKDNQPTLAEDIACSFIHAMESDFEFVRHDEYETHEKGHGRTEVRYYYTMPVPQTLRTAHEWDGLKSIGMTITHRHADVDGHGDVRYYINSFASDAKRFAGAVRGHWGIENSLHWVMDVTFREDESRIHKDHGGENVSWLRRLAISLIKRDTTIKDSIRSKRVRAGYDVEFLEQMLACISDEI
jgi:predicted transposase YbfD/YdcC